MDHLRGWPLYLVMALLGAFLLGAFTLVYALRPQSGGSWDFMQAALNGDEASSGAGAEPSGTQLQMAGNASNDWRVRRIEDLQARLDRTTADHEALKAKFEALETRQEGRGEGQGVSTSSDASSDDWIAELEAQTARSEDVPDANRDAGGVALSSETVAKLNKDLAATNAKLEATEFLYEMQVDELDRLKQRLSTSEQKESEADANESPSAQRSREIQSAASGALVQIGAGAVPILTNGLNDERPHVREWAADLLGAIGTNARDAVPALVEALADPDEYVRLAARRALDEIERQ